jgi:putative phosphoesterase
VGRSHRSLGNNCGYPWADSTPGDGANARYRRRKHVRVAIVSDTHGFVDARVLEIAGTCDVVVHAGDIGNATVLQVLRSVANQVLAIRGNNDTPAKWPTHDERVLSALPETFCVALPGGYLAVVHGHRADAGAARHQRLRRRYADARAIVYGHSHRMLCDCDEAPWVLNPGAAGRSRTFGGPSCLILSAAVTRWKVEAVRFQSRREHVSRNRQAHSGDDRRRGNRCRSMVS